MARSITVIPAKQISTAESGTAQSVQKLKMAAYCRVSTDQEESGIELRYFEPQHEGNPNVTLNLDLFGGLFLKNFNKNQNF